MTSCSQAGCFCDYKDIWTKQSSSYPGHAIMSQVVYYSLLMVRVPKKYPQIKAAEAIIQIKE